MYKLSVSDSTTPFKKTAGRTQVTVHTSGRTLRLIYSLVFPGSTKGTQAGRERWCPEKDSGQTQRGTGPNRWGHLNSQPQSLRKPWNKQKLSLPLMIRCDGHWVTQRIKSFFFISFNISFLRSVVTQDITEVYWLWKTDLVLINIFIHFLDLVGNIKLQWFLSIFED